MASDRVRGCQCLAAKTMSDGMPKCQPMLLEPVMAVEIAVPSDATARANGMISQRRGQIAGFDARPGWTGWDVIQARIPAAEMDELIVELRSMTAGVRSMPPSAEKISARWHCGAASTSSCTP